MQINKLMAMQEARRRALAAEGGAMGGGGMILSNGVGAGEVAGMGELECQHRHGSLDP